MEPPSDATDASFEDGYDNSHEALLAAACSETDNPRDASRWPTAAAAADRATPHFGADWTWLSLPCATWPGRDTDRFTGPFDHSTAHPMLFVNTRFDSANPYERAVDVAGRVPNARLLTVEGAGDPASFIPNECLTGAVAGYLVELQLPLAGALCEPDVVPFS